MKGNDRRRTHELSELQGLSLEENDWSGVMMVSTTFKYQQPLLPLLDLPSFK